MHCVRLLKQSCLALIAVVAACAPAHIAPRAAAVPVRFSIVQRALGFDADGNAQWLVRAEFLDKDGVPVRMLAGTNVDWRSPDANVQWQTRMRFGQPSAIVRTIRDGVMHAHITVTEPKLGSVNVVTDTRTWSGSRVVAAALGPHAAQIGWFPRAPTVRIERRDAARHSIIFDASGSSFRDTSVEPRHRYVYDVSIGHRRTRVTVETPSQPPPAPLDAVRGIGMWLSFSNNPIDDDYGANVDVDAIVERAVRAHLRYIELRTAYGAFFEITPDVRGRVDALIDGLAAHGIATIAWTVPRGTDIDDLRAAVQSVYYRTSRGTPIRGLALDLERGDDFMSGPASSLSEYIEAIRAALGSTYPIIATVEDPYFEHLDNATYPYARIAASASVLQPMSYWRMMRKHAMSPAEVAGALHRVPSILTNVAQRTIPISIGGQTGAEGPNGHPSPEEIRASVAGAKAGKAIGICYFDFTGTTPEQWSELEKLKY